MVNSETFCSCLIFGNKLGNYLCKFFIWTLKVFFFLFEIKISFKRIRSLALFVAPFWKNNKVGKKLNRRIEME